MSNEFHWSHSSVEELKLSKRSMAMLHEAGIKLVIELILQDEKELLSFRNFGAKSLAEIKRELAQYGLHLGMKVGG